MNAQGWGDQIHQRRLIADDSSAEKLCFRDVTTPAMSLNAPPVVSTLQDVLAILGDF